MEAKGQGATEEDNGAGDQGMMFGFACDETPERMPMPIVLAHKLCYRLSQVRKEGLLPYLRPDGKAQVTVEYHDGMPARVDAVVLSTQHGPEVEMETLRQDLLEHVVRQAIPAHLLDAATKYYINPTGRFVTGGPAADSGLTGRKIIVDTYGGYARHGGGAFSGKMCIRDSLCPIQGCPFQFFHKRLFAIAIAVDVIGEFFRQGLFQVSVCQ